MTPMSVGRGSNLSRTMMSGDSVTQNTLLDARKSLNTAERMSYSALRGFNKTEHLNRYVLEGEPGNKFRVSPFVPESITIHNAIPFLRDNRNVSNRTFTVFNSPKSEARSPCKRRATRHLRGQSHGLKVMRQKEKGWQGDSKPISGFNERVHSSMRLVFDKI